MNLSGQRVVIVGGTSGIGLATAHAAALEGAAVTVVSSSHERVAAATAELPPSCDGALLDVRDAKAVATFFEQLGEFDHLVFTAGDAFNPRRLAEVSPAEARAAFDVRFWGAVAVVASAAPRMTKNASIALTTGTVGERPVPGAALAAAGAAAAEGLVRGLAAELAPARVNAVRAGAIRTPLWDAVPPPQRTALFANLANRTLVGTIGEAENVALAHLYLMKNHYVTGTVLTVDGGLLLAG